MGQWVNLQFISLHPQTIREMYTMYINDLVIETTRRCNMNCGHCLRGNAQNKHMKDEYLYEFLKQVDYVGSVAFSGGEPTLPSGMKVIERFMEICNELNVRVGNFYIATNGKVWRDDFPELINRLFNLCEDNEMSSIDISGDQFHESDKWSINQFKFRLEEELYDYYNIDEIVSIRPDIDRRFVITQGRGACVGYNERIHEIIIYENEEDEFRINEGTIYLNCNGQIIAGCDWSYETQEIDEDVQICNTSEDLKHAVMAYHKSFI